TISYPSPSTKRLLSLADRPGCLHLGWAQPGSWPAWKGAWIHVLSLSRAPASAEICQSFAGVIQSLFLGTPASFEAAVEPFNPDADMKAAATQLKTLVDLLPKNTKDSILKLMDKIAKSPLCA
uniref:Uteroglobin n=3 Tax=Equus TaxID=9789 RepID=A0A9L0JI19_EQUAS